MNITRLFFASLMMITATMSAEPISSPNKRINVEIKNDLEGFRSGIKEPVFNNKPTLIRYSQTYEQKELKDTYLFKEILLIVIGLPPVDQNPTIYR